MRQTRSRNNPRQRTRGSPRVTPAGAYVVSITRLSIRTADHNFGSIRCDMLDPWRAYMWLPLIMASPKSLCRAIHPACSNISLMAAKPGAASEYRRPQMRPPSTTRSSPLMNPASSLARKTAELAISSVMPETGDHLQLGKSLFDLRDSLLRRGVVKACSLAKDTCGNTAGEIELTRTPSSPSSIAAQRDMWTTAALATA